MKLEFIEKLDTLRTEYDAVVEELADPSVYSDQKRFKELSRRHKELEAIVNCATDIKSVEGDIASANELIEMADSDDEIAELREEIARLEERRTKLNEELEVLLLPRDENDGKNVILEIRGAEGGEEANLFAKDLFEMYIRYADRMGWKNEVLGADPSERGGYNEATLLVKGEDAWRRLKHEGGPHRVQRVPVTESQGRIHTSSATVTVLPEADEVDVHIDPNDLRIDVYRSTGPGGQSVNTTDSAVRITHIPSGLVVAMQDEKSQIQNRAKALQVLRARLLKMEQDKQEEAMSSARRSQVGGGGRSEKIRTYNFKENRITDHRIGLTIYKLDRVLFGELDEISDALLLDERARQLGGEDD
ncbi:MAG: peptide chain release factor 1 [Actinomycetota bacterium]|nr:peptide chain release factor 1 [Actinomycetota bacterium]